MYHDMDQSLSEQIVGLHPGASLPNTGGTTTTIDWSKLKNASINAGPITTADIKSFTPRVRLSDDMELELDDGSCYTGKELKVMLKMLKKLALEEYPEEFV